MCAWCSYRDVILDKESRMGNKKCILLTLWRLILRCVFIILYLTLKLQLKPFQWKMICLFVKSPERMSLSCWKALMPSQSNFSLYFLQSYGLDLCANQRVNLSTSSNRVGQIFIQGTNFILFRGNWELEISSPYYDDVKRKGLLGRMCPSLCYLFPHWPTIEISYCIGFPQDIHLLYFWLLLLR